MDKNYRFASARFQISQLDLTNIDISKGHRLYTPTQSSRWK
jgi:hypothetical protein